MSTNVDVVKFKVQTHPGHARIREIILDEEAIRQFFNAVNEINIERLEYVPFERFYLAYVLRQILGESFQHEIRAILHDRTYGGFIIGVQEQTKNIDDYIKFSTAITHLIGTSNFDAMSGKYYARFTVKNTDESDTYLRQAYRNLELHTDGVFVEEETDWLLMMKFVEENAIGGESRFLHLDDWDEMNTFKQHSLAAHEFKYSYADRGSKKVNDLVYNTTFYEKDNTTCMRFNHQCTHPQTIEQALYLKQLQESIENTRGTISVPLPVGQLVMLNNHFWIHGREAFEKSPGLNRELMRQRGRFARV
jgi:glutarate dioxygenase